MNTEVLDEEINLLEENSSKPPDLFTDERFPRRRKKRMPLFICFAGSLFVGTAFLEVPFSSVRAVGHLEPGAVADLSMPVSGWISGVHIKEGATVHSGEVIAQIENPELVSEKKILAEEEEIYRAEIEKLNAELAERQLELSREEELLQIGVVAPVYIHRLKADFELKKFFIEREIAIRERRIDMAEERLHALDELLSHDLVRAPIDGVVMDDLERKEGNFLHQGVFLGAIADLSDAYLEVAVKEEELRKIEPGNTVSIRFYALPDEEVWGTVTGFDHSAYSQPERPRAAQRLVSVRIEPEVLPPNARPGLSAKVKIITDTRPDVLNWLA